VTVGRRRRTIGRRLGAVAVLALALAAPASAQRVRLGGPAPEIDLPALGGGRVQLSKLRGHPVVVSFWTTWCPSCRTEFPDLVRAQQTHGPAGLKIVGVNGRNQELSTKDVQKFVDEFSLPFPVALDQRGRALQAFRILGLPTMVFVDSGGVIRQIHRGPISHEDLDRAIAAILPSL
jgi:cytochrome c biogenesis protein CcmG, thiol:disulfide interchange protein DsbE